MCHHILSQHFNHSTGVYPHSLPHRMKRDDVVLDDRCNAFNFVPSSHADTSARTHTIQEGFTSKHANDIEK